MLDNSGELTTLWVLVSLTVHQCGWSRGSARHSPCQQPVLLNLGTALSTPCVPHRLGANRVLQFSGFHDTSDLDSSIN